MSLRQLFQETFERSFKVLWLIQILVKARRMQELLDNIRKDTK
jgi:hypothetical protein